MHAAVRPRRGRRARHTAGRSFRIGRSPGLQGQPHQVDCGYDAAPLRPWRALRSPRPGTRPRRARTQRRTAHPRSSASSRSQPGYVARIDPATRATSISGPEVGHASVPCRSSPRLHVDGIVPAARTQLEHDAHWTGCCLYNACAVVFCLFPVLVGSRKQVEPAGQIRIQPRAFAHGPLRRYSARLCQGSRGPCLRWPSGRLNTARSENTRHRTVPPATA